MVFMKVFVCVYVCEENSIKFKICTRTNASGEIVSKSFNHTLLC